MDGATAALGRRVDRSRTALALAAADVALVVLVLVAGEVRHGVDPVAGFPTVADTLAPFLVGWLLASVAAGVHRAETRTDARVGAARTAAAWTGAALVGAGLRATPLFHGDAPPTFVAVTVLAGLVVLVPWRTAVAYVRRRRGRGAPVGEGR